jgi:hypothetical protein
MGMDQNDFKTWPAITVDRNQAEAVGRWLRSHEKPGERLYVYDLFNGSKKPRDFNSSQRVFFISDPKIAMLAKLMFHGEACD